MSARLDRLTALAAALIVVAGLIVAGVLVPSSVDRVSTTSAIGTAKVVATAHDPSQVRVGYLFLVAGLLCIAPATRRVVALAVGPGAAAVEVGWRLVAIGAAAGAVGNAFAPMILPSTAPFDPTVMGRFVHHHETSVASYVIIAFYLLLPLGALVLLVGLIRGRSLAWWHAALLTVSLGAITPLRLGPQSIVDGVVLGVALVLLHRERGPSKSKLRQEP